LPCAAGRGSAAAYLDSQGHEALAQFARFLEDAARIIARHQWNCCRQYPRNCMDIHIQTYKYKYIYTKHSTAACRPEMEDGAMGPQEAALHEVRENCEGTVLAGLCFVGLPSNPSLRSREHWQCSCTENRREPWNRLESLAARGRRVPQWKVK